MLTQVVKWYKKQCGTVPKGYSKGKYTYNSIREGRDVENYCCYNEESFAKYVKGNNGFKTNILFKILLDQNTIFSLGLRVK